MGSIRLKEFLFVTFILCMASVSLFGEETFGSVRILISGFRNNEGTCRIALFNSSEGFPEDAEKAFVATFVIIEDKKVDYTFQQLPNGTYAFSLFHDENSNGLLETGLFGIPLEGYGASNNAKGFFGPPEFLAASFTISGSGENQNITIQY